MVIFYSYVSLPEDTSPNPNHHSNDVTAKSSKMNKNDTFPRSRRYDGPMLEAMPARQPPITIIYPDSSIHKHIVNIVNIVDIIKYPYIYISIYSFIIYPWFIINPSITGTNGSCKPCEISRHGMPQFRGELCVTGEMLHDGQMAWPGTGDSKHEPDRCVTQPEGS
jgi:hypothetical protein